MRSKVKLLVNFRNKEFADFIVKVNKGTESLFGFHSSLEAYASITHMHCWISFAPLAIVLSGVVPLAPLAPLKNYKFIASLSLYTGLFKTYTPLLGRN